MSSRLQEQKQHPQSPIASAAGKFAILVLVVGAFAGAWYLGKLHAQGPVDHFAQCLTDQGAKMYGLYWCPHCEEQKKAFGASFRKVSYVECGTSDHKAEPRCVQDHVVNFPTWQFADGSRHEGELSFEDLAAKTGCSLQ